MKRIVILLVILLVGVNLTACTLFYGSADWQACTICILRTVPGLDKDELKGGPTADIIEYDGEGRIFFKYKAENWITGKEETILGIIQHNDKKFVYFYEDIHFIPYTTSKEKIEEFKSLNDWEQQLNLGKMSKKSLRTLIDSDILPFVNENIEMDVLLQKLSKQLGVDEDQISYFQICYDGKETELYLLRFPDRDNVEKSYWMTCNEDYEISCVEFDPENIDMKELSEFKRSNGWYYGCD